MNRENHHRNQTRAPREARRHCAPPGSEGFSSLIAEALDSYLPSAAEKDELRRGAFLLRGE